MRNTKLILAMVAGCTIMSGAAFAQDSASQQASPTPASTAATPTQGSSSKMDKTGSENGAMKSTHKKHKAMKKSSTDSSGSEPAKSSSAGM